MTFVSYARNFEDVLLWRALRGVKNGFYVDVGAAHPDTNSVTRAFYDRGWSGINVEPTVELSLRLKAARPRDINVQIALGERPSRAVLAAADGAGLSAIDPAVIDIGRQPGVHVRDSNVDVDTLANLCRRHAPATTHFLKIDVQGAERAVLAGADFKSFRPWIVLVEATTPISIAAAHDNWEFILLDADYGFVWFDGLNRFYVSAEMHDELAHAFKTPVNVFDDFLRAADSEWVRRIQEAEGRAKFESAAAADARLRAEDLARDSEQLRMALQRETARRLAAEAHAAAEAQHAEHEAQRSAINEQRQLEAMTAFDAMRRSTSWRITAPLRSLRSRRNAAGPVITQPPPAAPVIPAPVQLTVKPRRTPVPPRTTVHQFHSGAATGDAITNSMLLTRQRLRDLGYRSEIFVSFRDPELSHELRLAEDLPRHEHYVLIVRHSMGFDAFEAVASLPAPKVLLYHNITPPEFLQGDVFMQRYAVLGREQLRQWRDLVCSALADSAYNAIELRTLGFHPVQVCNTLIDVDGLIARAAATPKLKHQDCFTMLFVGRVVHSKGQLELVDVFAAFRERYRKPCRLVLVGRNGGSGDPYLTAIEARMREHGIVDDVVLTGAVSDEALHDWYASADVYLSLSHHEGFGVPLLEAIAHDVPVLARAAAAVPFTLSGTDSLLEDDAIDSVAARLLDLAEREQPQAALVARQHVALELARWEYHKPALLYALTAAGAAPPGDAAAPSLLSSSMQFTVTGHVNGSYSLAAINRTLARALDSARPGCVRLAPVEGGATTYLGAVPGAEQAEIAALAARPKPLTGPHVVISQHYPVHVPAEPGDLALAYFFWEESVVPEEAITELNENFRGVLAPTAFVAKTLIDSGLSIPVRVTGLAPRLDAFRTLALQRRGTQGRPFTFLHVSSGFPRKGIDVLLAAYARAFRRADQVHLVIKVFPNPHNTVADQIADWQVADDDTPKITLIDRDLEEVEVLSLYRDADTVVLPTRGEGFNLPAAEAMAAGLPLIVTGYGGHLDFCNESVRLIEYSFAHSGSHLAASGSLWVEPDMDDLARALGEAVSDRAPRAKPPSLPSAQVFAERIVTVASELLLLPPARRLRIGWVSTWGVRCGIAEYSRHLLGAMLAADDAGDVTVLCDGRTSADAPEALDLAVFPCWGLTPPDGVKSLTRTVAMLDPDILVVQHQPGLMAWGMLATLLGSAPVKGRLVVLVLHTTQGILDITEEDRHAVIQALGSVARIVVHTIHDVNRLKTLELVTSVVMFPQGTVGLDETVRRPVAVSAERPAVVGCYGFFVKGKGIPQLIEAIALLRERHGPVRLRLINAEYDSLESASEIARCRAAVDAAGLADAVEWHTDFLLDSDSRSLLRTCDIIVLPYQGSKEGSSAALRMAMSAGVPVAVTPLPLFDEAEAAVFRFRGMSSADLADGIAFLLQRSEQRAAIQEQMRLWVDRRRWPLIAKRFHGMLKGLSLNWTHLDPAPPHADGVMPPMVHRSAPFLASV